jgi:hypothetical protein
VVNVLGWELASLATMTPMIRRIACSIVAFLACLSGSSLAAVDVANFATSGSGSQASPWVGWDAAVSWQPETEYFFRKGYYAYMISPNFLKTGIALRGEAGTVLQFNGVGNAVVFDNPGGSGHDFSDWTMNVRMENFIIQGTTGATNGLYLRAVRNGIFRHISVRDVSGACVWGEALVTNMIENLRCSHHEMPNDTFNVVPAYGIVLGTRGAADSTTTTTVTNAVIEGVSQVGVWIKAGSFSNTFLNGTSEGNLGKGMVIDGFFNTIVNMDFEANGSTDVEINEAGNELQGVVSAGLVYARFGYLNKLRGRFTNVTIDYADYTDLTGAFIAGVLTEGVPTTIKVGYYVKGEFRNDSFVGNVLTPIVSLTMANGVIATDARKSSLFYVLMTSDVMLAVPTNGVDGQRVTWKFQQDSAGGRALKFGDGFASMSGQLVSGQSTGLFNPIARTPQVTVNAASNSVTEISARYDASSARWLLP